MEKYVIFVIFTVLLPAVTPNVTNPQSSKQYRSDYVYNHETDAFYKFHTDWYSQWRSGKVCRAEGADLMGLDSEQDVIQQLIMVHKFPDHGGYVWVADDGKTHKSAEPKPLTDRFPMNETNLWRNMIFNPIQYGMVVRRDGEVRTAQCERQFPFICAVKAEDAPYDTRCGVYGAGYKYFESTGSCYKIPRVPYTWSRAYSHCAAEGSHLVMINSVLEHEVVHNFTMTEPPVSEDRMSWYFFAGFRADRPPKNTYTTAPPRVFKTIFDQTLEQAGYSFWADGEPNNLDGNEYCGTVFKNDGKFYDMNCDDEHPFICEKEVQRSS